MHLYISCNIASSSWSLRSSHFSTSACCYLSLRLRYKIELNICNIDPRWNWHEDGTEIKRCNYKFVCYFSTTDSAMDLSINNTDYWYFRVMVIAIDSNLLLTLLRQRINKPGRLDKHISVNNSCTRTAVRGWRGRTHIIHLWYVDAVFTTCFHCPQLANKCYL